MKHLHIIPIYLAIIIFAFALCGLMMDKKEKNDFLIDFYDSRCQASCKRLETCDEWKVIKNNSYSDPNCYVKNRGFFMELSDNDIENLLDQRK